LAELRRYRAGEQRGVDGQRGEIVQSAEARRQRASDAGLGEPDHDEPGAVANLRGQRVLEVLVPAAAEHLEARHPADRRWDPPSELVVIEAELAQSHEVADGVRDGALQAVGVEVKRLELAPLLAQPRRDRPCQRVVAEVEVRQCRQAPELRRDRAC
jgi:hypothetical protein